MNLREGGIKNWKKKSNKVNIKDKKKGIECMGSSGSYIQLSAKLLFLN